MPRQVLHPVPEIGELAHPRIQAVHADLAQMPGQRLAAVHELEAMHQFGEPIDQAGVKAQRLADLTRGAAVAVGDDVGRHRRAQLPVALVDVLDHALAPVAAGQVEIDVGPLAALFREEPLEEQLHPDRVDRGDAEAVTHGAVGRRTPALHQNPALAAEVDQVPDDEEVAGQIELLDQIQFAPHLRTRPIVVRPIPLARAHLRDPAQKRRHRLPRRHRVLGKAIAQIGHRVLEPIGQRARGGDGLRQIGKARRHGVRRSQVALGIGHQPPAGLRQRRLVVETREDVVERPLVWRGEPHAAGGDDGHAVRGGQIDEHLVVDLLGAIQMPRDRDMDAVATEGADQPIEQSSHAVLPRVEQRLPRQRHQAGDVAVEIVQRERALPFRRTQLHLRQQPAQILVARPGRDEDGKGPGDCGLRIADCGLGLWIDGLGN